MTSPERPEGVVLHTAGGQVPVEVSYAGVRDGDGIHVWHADSVIPLDQVLHVTIKRLPAKTMVSFLAGGES